MTTRQITRPAAGRSLAALAALGLGLAAALAALARDAVEVDADPMMSAEYKQQLVATLTQRALARIAASRSEAA